MEHHLEPSLCNGVGLIQNISWWAFVAGSAEMTFNLEVNGDCTVTNKVQVGIWSDCSGTCVAGSGDCVEEMSFNFNDAILGNVYYLYVDGCEGSECNFIMSIDNTAPYEANTQGGILVESECGGQLNNCSSGVTNQIISACPGQILTLMPVHQGDSATFDESEFADECAIYNPELEAVFTFTFSDDLGMGHF